MIQSYRDQLLSYANRKNISLFDATVAAGIPTSTYYRSVYGQRELRLETASKIAAAIDELAKRMAA